MPQPSKFSRHGHGSRVGPVALPAGGRQGDPPPWPASRRATKAELETWAALWATPQAVMWEELGWTREVARYCRLLVAAERPGAMAALHAQATALSDRLGLTPKAMRLLLWTVGPPAAPASVLDGMVDHVRRERVSRYAHLRAVELGGDGA